MGERMKSVICTNCEADNLIANRNEDFICASCKKQVSPPDYESLYQSEKRRADRLYDANEEIADRLRARDREVERLCKLLEMAKVNYDV